MYDSVIIGAGISGITAAIYAKRGGLNFSIFEKGLLGGQLNYIEKVDNFPTVNINTEAREVIALLKNQIEALGIEVVYKEVTSLRRKGDYFEVFSEGEKVESQTLIIATGASPRSLNLNREKELRGKGVSYCAICDGFFFRGKVVGVVGGGNTAVEEALYLSKLAKKVYLIHRRDKLRAFNYLAKEALSCPNIEVIWDSVVSELLGEERLEGVVLNNLKDKSFKELKLEGLFIAIGYLPNTRLVKGLVEQDEEGFIKVGPDLSTSCPGIFSSGDCTQKNLRQLITAASEGATAAISCLSYLDNLKIEK